MSGVENKDDHIERLAPPPDNKTKWMSTFGSFVLQISFFGQYAGGVALLHYPAYKPGSLISAVPAQASGSVNLQGGD